MEQNKFSLVMKLKSNTELLLIIRNHEDYNAEALKAAQIELQRRNLPQEELDAKIEFLLELEQEKVAKAEEPLGEFSKISNFIFPINGLLQLISIHKAEGYDLKVKQANTWAGYGCLFYFILFAMMLIISSVA